VKTKPFNAPDILVGLLIAASGLLVGWPVLSGGYATYLDNPAHTAEVHSLAADGGNGWSGIAYCGYPLGQLHSPFWYGLMALWVRVGFPLAPLYSFLVWLGFVAPAVALYWVARRRAGPLPSALLAYVLLIQRPTIVGVGSAFGGMWPFYLAGAGFILLADRLGRAPRRMRDVPVIGLLVGGILLTHVFVATAVAYLLLVHVALTVSSRGVPRRTLGLDGAAVMTGLAAGAVYWLPNVLSRDVFVPAGWHLGAGQLVRALFLPVDVHHLFTSGIASGRLFLTDALPLISLPAAGLAGIWLWWRRGRGVGDGAPDRLPAYGFGVAVVLLVLLFLFVRRTDVPILGGISWRQLFFVRVGMALAALPLLARTRGPRGPRGRVWAVGLTAAGALAAIWWGTPLRDQVADPRGSEMADVGKLWGWLQANRQPSWGRVYLQDTFLVRLNGERLIHSHVLARTSHEAGVQQLGAFYKAVPLPTAQWTGSDRGRLFENRIRTSHDVRNLLADLRLTNCTHLVLVVPELVDAFASAPGFRERFRAGRFAVFEVEGATSRWCQPLSEGLQARTAEYGVGDIGVELSAENAGGRLLVKESFHPFWRVEGNGTERIVPHVSGLTVVEGIGTGESTLRLQWAPPRYPAWISLAGFVLLSAAIAFARRRESH
jgi:hypothetical protein